MITITGQLAGIHRVIGENFLCHAFTVSMFATKSSSRAQIGGARHLKSDPKEAAQNEKHGSTGLLEVQRSNDALEVVAAPQ